MSFKLVILLLGVMLLVQASLAATSPEASSKKVIENPFKATLRSKLNDISLEKMEDFIKLIKGNLRTIFKRVLEDPQVRAVKTETMQETVKRVQKLLDKIDQNQNAIVPSIKIFYNIVDEFDDILKKFFKRMNENYSEDEKIFAKSLVENCIGDFDNGTEEHYTKFIEKCSKEIEQYIEGLTEKEKKGEESLITWLKNLKAENDTEKKNEMVNHIFSEIG